MNALGAALAASLFAVHALPQAGATGTVTGRVLDALGEGLAAVEVWAARAVIADPFDVGPGAVVVRNLEASETPPSPEVTRSPHRRALR